MLSDKDDVITDLRARPDAEADKRRLISALLEALTPPAALGPRQHWWSQLLGGGEKMPGRTLSHNTWPRRPSSFY